MFPMGYFGGGRPRPAVRWNFTIPPDKVVILLGAGASAPAGTPLMKGFIDRARDIRTLGKFESDELVDVNRALDLYESLRSALRITEEDVENVESLLSLAELANVLRVPELDGILHHGISDNVRRFIDRTITKSIQLPDPMSPDWYPGQRQLVYRDLVFLLSILQSRVTVISLNYDCILEYSCYCMGLPFTYNTTYSDVGVEILKLHGSSNWLSCEKEGCSSRGKEFVSSLIHHRYVLVDDHGEGLVDRSAKLCSVCGSKLVPVIVPPSWRKTVVGATLGDTWTRACRVLLSAETVIVIGCSLPPGDADVRQLLHLGLTSARLRQVLVVLSDDVDAADRWKNLFRPSFRNVRVHIDQGGVVDAVNYSIPRALALQWGPDREGGMLLPVDQNPFVRQDIGDRIQAGLGEAGLHNRARFGKLGGILWSTIARRMREGSFSDELVDSETLIYHRILQEAGYANWRPIGDILPTHGTSLIDTATAG